MITLEQNQLRIVGKCRPSYLVVIVLHDLPVEATVFGPGKVVFDGIPIHPRLFQAVLTIQVPVLVLPGDLGAGLGGVQVDIDESVSVDVDVDGEETDIRGIEGRC